MGEEGGNNLDLEVAKAVEDLIARPSVAITYLKLAWCLQRAGMPAAAKIVYEIADERWNRAKRPSAG